MSEPASAYSGKFPHNDFYTGEIEELKRLVLSGAGATVMVETLRRFKWHQIRDKIAALAAQGFLVVPGHYAP